jgi:hypothetical protein
MGINDKIKELIQQHLEGQATKESDINTRSKND